MDPDLLLVQRNQATAVNVLSANEMTDVERLMDLRRREVTSGIKIDHSSLAKGGGREIPQDTFLMDVNFNEIGAVLATIKRTTDFIVRKGVDICAEAFSFVLDEIAEAENVMLKKLCLKKFIWLPSLLFTEDGEKARSIVSFRVKKILAKDWDFRIADLVKRPTHWSPSVEQLEDDENEQHGSRTLEKQIKRAMKVGEIGTAFDVLKRTASRARVDNTTVAEIRALFPAAPRHLAGFEHEEEFRIPDAVELNSEEDGAKKENQEFADEGNVWDFVMRSSRTVSPGLDNLRYNHIRQMCDGADDAFPVRAGFVNRLVKFTNDYLNGLLPKEFNDFSSEAEVFPLKKPNGTYRPIMLIGSFRKMAGAIGAKSFEDLNLPIFGDIQVGIRRAFGTEQIIHAMTASMIEHPGLDRAFVDLKNAFNMIDRTKMLQAVKLQYPKLLKYFQQTYGGSTSAWMRTDDGGIFEVESEMGVHQGDPLAPIGFALTVHSLFKDLSQAANDMTAEGKGFGRAYLDDLSISGSMEAMNEIFAGIYERGPALGIELNKDKTVILMGKRQSAMATIYDYNNYLAIGFTESNIKIHPDNYSSFTNGPGRELMDKEYGTTCLGSPIGSDSFQQEWLKKKMLNLVETKNKLVEGMASKQAKMLMLRMCLAQQVNHLARTLSPRLTRQFLQDFDNLKIEMVADIADCPLVAFKDHQRRQCLMHLRDGGLGLHSSELSNTCAYAASIVAVLPSLCDIFADIPETLDKHWLQTRALQCRDATFRDWNNSMRDKQDSAEHCSWIFGFTEAMRSLTNKYAEGAKSPPLYEILVTGTKVEKLQNRLFKPIRKRILGEFMDNLPCDKDRHRMQSCRGNGEDACAWLESTPSMSFTTIQCPDFRVALCLRLGLDFMELKRSTRGHKDNQHHVCPYGQCRKTFRDDGHHFMLECKCSGRKNTHNAVCDVVAAIVRESHHALRREVEIRGFRENNQL